MIDVNFYTYSGKNNVVNKTLPTATVISGLLYDRFNVLNPTLTIRTQTAFNFNYCYIAALNRYYFVDKVEIVDNQKTEVYLSVDVLKSYETEILAANGTITARENANKFISNREVIFNRVPKFDKIDFSVNTPFDENGNIIMVTIKGNS